MNSANKPAKKPLYKRPLFIVPMVVLGLFLIAVIALILIPLPEESGGGIILAPVAALTDNGGGSYTYDDGQMALAINVTPQTAAETGETSNAEITQAKADAESVLNGESDGKSWTVTTDGAGNSTVYIAAGDSLVKAEIEKLPDSYGKENAAAVVSALISENRGYVKGKADYSTAYATYYIEAADCILYYPAQLTVVSAKEDSSLVIKDTRSDAVLRVTLTENSYSSMDELENFISDSENNLLLAYGPAWFSSEQKKSGKTVFGYDGLGQNYIVEATLTYSDADAWVFDELRSLIKTKFIGDGIWVSKAKAPGYTNEASAVYGPSFSRELSAYYDASHGAILLYPELFSKKSEHDGLVEFTDPVTGAKISYYEDSTGSAMKDFAGDYGYDDSYIDGEHRVRMSDLSGGRYAVAYFLEDSTMAAELYYPEEYEWVYGEFYSELTIVTAADEIHNTEMQTIKVEEYGALITIPLQFSEVGFYGGVMYFDDTINGMELTVTFSDIEYDEQRTNIFECFDCSAADEDITAGDGWLRWENNSGFYYGARGSSALALLKLDSPNARTAYATSIDEFKVEFAMEASREVTIADEVKLEAQTAVETAQSKPAAQTTAGKSSEVTAAKVPNSKLTYNYDYEYAYVAMDAESWFEADESDDAGETNFGSYAILMTKLNAVKDIVSVLSYNNYTFDDQSADYLTEVAQQMNEVLKNQYYGGESVTSDLGDGIPSVFETMCLVMDIPKPEYVDHRYDYVLPQRTDAETEPEDYENGINLNDEETEEESGYTPGDPVTKLRGDGVMAYNDGSVSYTYDVSGLLDLPYFYSTDDGTYYYDHVNDSYYYETYSYDEGSDRRYYEEDVDESYYWDSTLGWYVLANNKKTPCDIADAYYSDGITSVLPEPDYVDGSAMYTVRVDDGTEFSKTHEVLVVPYGTGRSWLYDVLLIRSDDYYSSTDYYYDETMAMYAIYSIRLSRDYDYICIGGEIHATGEAVESYFDGLEDFVYTDEDTCCMITGGHVENGEYVADDYFIFVGLDPITMKIDANGEVIEQLDIWG